MSWNITPYALASAAMGRGVSILLFRSGEGVRIEGDIISPSFFIGLCHAGMKFSVSLEDWGMVKFIRVKEIKRGNKYALHTLTGGVPVGSPSHGGVAGHGSNPMH